MCALKTQPNKKSVNAFIDAVENPVRKKDCKEVARMMEEITGEKPVMWGDSIIGYGSYHYVYASGREGDWPLTGFSPRKQALTLYIMAGFKRYDELMKKLGTFKTGSSCLYVKKLEDIDQEVLKQLIRESVAYMKERYKTS